MFHLNCLIVDDDPMYNVVAESILGSLTSGKVYSAGSGTAGLDLLGTCSPAIDVVLLDLNMPDLDGLAFMRAAAEAGFDGSIIISSGETPQILRSAETMAKMIGISVIGVLAKPLTIDGVMTALQKAAQNQRASPASSKSSAFKSEFELTPYYQPQYDLCTGKIAGVEALIRLTAKDGRVLGPGPLFETITTHADLVDTSMKIATLVVGDAGLWHQSPAPPVVSINFDASVLEQPAVVAALQKAVIDYSLDPRRLCLEVTEKSLPKDPSRLVEALTRLRMTGFRLSLDDYGMGASSFELLRLCPFSEIKVDRSIIGACTTDPVTRKFLHAVAGLARDLDLTSVAEGVENEAELAEVRTAGMDRVQGFLFSRPLPVSSLAALSSLYETATER